jgi:hypothetical protein
MVLVEVAMKSATIKGTKPNWSVIMTTEMIIIGIFCIVDDVMGGISKCADSKLYPSELVTVGILFALKGGRFRAFYRWLKRDFDAVFGGLPERTRLQRSLAAHEEWFDLFLAQPSAFTVMDSYPIELLFPVREGRSQQQIGKKGRDKGRWIIGGRLWVMLDTYGRIIEWHFLTLDHADKHFNRFATPFAGQTVTLTDLGFRDAQGAPDHLKFCQKGTWNERMVVETVFSMLTVVCNLKKLFHRTFTHLFAHLSCVAAMFNVLYTLFHQLHPDASPFNMSIAEFSL